MSNANATKGKSTKITNFDAATCRSLAARIEAALAPLAEELGLSITTQGGKYLGGSFALKLEAAVKTSDGVDSRDAQMFNMFADRVGLRADMLGQTFTQSGRTFKVTGYNPRASRQPVLATAADGRTYKFTVEAVARAFSLPSPRSTTAATAVNG